MRYQIRDLMILILISLPVTGYVWQQWENVRLTKCVTDLGFRVLEQSRELDRLKKSIDTVEPPIISGQP